MFDYYESLIAKVDECRSLAHKVHLIEGVPSWEAELDELYQDMLRSYRCEKLDNEWATYFQNKFIPTIPDKYKGDIRFFFGYIDDSKTSNPNLLTFNFGLESLEIPFQSDDIESAFELGRKKILSFARQCSA